MGPYEQLAQVAEQRDGLDGHKARGRLGPVLLGGLGCLGRALFLAQLLREAQLAPALPPVLLCARRAASHEESDPCLTARHHMLSFAASAQPVAMSAARGAGEQRLQVPC
jgi:hypothetical protein